MELFDKAVKKMCFELYCRYSERPNYIAEWSLISVETFFLGQQAFPIKKIDKNQKSTEHIALVNVNVSVSIPKTVDENDPKSNMMFCLFRFHFLISSFFYLFLQGGLKPS